MSSCNFMQSQEFMPQVARGFVSFVFMLLKLLYRHIICTGPAIYVDSEDE